MVIKARFKIFEHIVCDDQRTLYQLEHFKNKRTYPFKKLTYNPQRKAYRIYGQWVTSNRLYKLMVQVNEIIEVCQPLTDLQRLMQKLQINPAQPLKTKHQTPKLQIH